MKIFNRIIAMILVFASICTVIPTSVYAKTVDKNTKGHIEIKVDENGNPTEETINEISESLEFIVEEALILDSDGGIIGVDANKLIKRFGHSPNLDKLAEITNKEIDKNGKVMPNKDEEITNKTKEERIFYSDQGWAYQVKQYTSKLESNGIGQSMSRKGNYLDNSPMENFFGILKQEIYYGNKFYSYEHLKQTIEDFIKYYNEERIKEKLGYLSPVEYRKKNAT